MIIIPKPGLSIKDPDQQDIIPAEGRAVANTEYWFRRLIDGDVTLAPSGYTPVKPIFQETASGTTAERPNPAKLGDFRHNTELKAPEMFVGAPVGWLVFDGGASAAAAAGKAAGEAAGVAAAQSALQSATSKIVMLNAEIDALKLQVEAILNGTTPPVVTPPVVTPPAASVPVGLTPPVIVGSATDVPVGVSAPVIGDAVSGYVQAGYVEPGYFQ